MDQAQVATSPESDRERTSKRVGLLIGLTGIALFALMGLLGLGMRLTQAEVLGLSDQWFYKIMTLHGAGMLVAALLALMGGLWYLLRDSLRLCVGRMIASYLLIVLGALTVLVAVIFGGFATGWTFLWPLPFNSLNQWSEWATTTFLIGMVLVGAGFMVYCIELLSRMCQRYGSLGRAYGISFLRGRDDDPPTPPQIAATVIAVVGLIASAVGVTILAALLGRVIDPQIDINALWAKNMTFFFGHTVANLIIYLGAGVIYVLLPRFAGRPWKTTKPIVIGWLFTTLLVITAFGHHLYMDFVQPHFASVIGSVSSFGAALPVAVVTLYTGLMLVWGSRYRWTLGSTLLYLGFAGWAIGGTGAVIDSLIPVNFRFHNTLWVPAHFHTYMLLAAIMWVLAFSANLLEGMARQVASKFSRVASPLLMLLGGYGLVVVWYLEGALGEPRRYAQQIGQGDTYSLVASMFVIIFALGFLVILAEFVRLGRLAMRNRGSGAAPAMAGGSPETDTFSGPSNQQGLLERPPITKAKCFIAAAVFAVAAFIALLPPVIDASLETVQWHHLDHAIVFFLGLMIGAMLVSLPSVWRWLGDRFQTAGLITVIAAPTLAMMAMVPKFYSGLEGRPLIHALYHLIFLVLGFATAVGASRLGRVTAWVLIIATATMGAMYAGGVSSL